jgi:O-antigen ligase
MSLYEGVKAAPVVIAKPSLGAYVVGAYLFSVPAFAYSESLGLLMIPQVLGALLVGFAVLDILGNMKIKIPLEIGLYGLMGLAAVITFFIGPDISEWGTLSLGTLVKVVIATLACAQLIKDETDFFVALKIFVMSILIAFLQNMGDLQTLRVADKMVDTERFAGTFTDPNTAAIFSLTVIWAALLLWLHAGKSFFARAWLLVPAVISLVIIYYSGSKKGLLGLGLLALFVARMIYAQQRPSPYRKVLILVAAAVLIVAAGYFIYISPFFFRLQELIYGGSAGDVNRYYLAQDALNIWLTNVRTFLIGVGYDNFRFVSELQTNSHSTPLEILACNGLIGFSLFMGFLYLLFHKFIWLYRKALSPESRRVFYLVIIFLVIYSFFMLAHVLHTSRELLPLFGGLAAFGQYHLNRLRQGPVDEPDASVEE